MALLATLLPATSFADDSVASTVTYFAERRPGTDGLKVIHPQADVGIDLGTATTLNAGYDADVVSGATYALYAPTGPGQTVDVVSSATKMSDTRHEGKGGLTFRGRRSSLSVGYVYGTERDYHSHSVSGAATIDLPGKNSTFAISYAHNFDFVCDFDNGEVTPLERRPLTGVDKCFTAKTLMSTTVTHDIAIDTTEASLTQNVTPDVVMQFGVHGQVIDGFQSNPYRRVRVEGVDAQEHTPLVRARGALFARANVAFPAAHSALSALVRGYADTWGVNSFTAEMTYSQYVGRSLLIRLRARAYEQSGAVFFWDAMKYQNFGPPPNPGTNGTGSYFTGDRELAPLRDALVGAKLSYLATSAEGKQVWGVFDSLDFHLKADLIYAESLVPNAPGGDPKGIAPDQLVLELGLQLRW